MIKISVECYGVLRELCGAQITLPLPAGGTVEDLLQKLGDEFPATWVHLPGLACAQGDALVSRHFELKDEDRVALLPPVSGG